MTSALWSSPNPGRQHPHHGRLDCYKSSLIISHLCFTELYTGPLPTPLQGTALPTHSPGDRGQEKASSSFPGQLRVLENAGPALRHTRRVHPSDSLSGPGPVQTLWPRQPRSSPAHLGTARTARPRLIRAAWVGLAQAGEGVLLLMSAKAPLSRYLNETVKSEDRSIAVETKLTHAVGSHLTAQGALSTPPPSF